MAVASGRPAGSLSRRQWALLLAFVAALVVVAVASGLLLRTMSEDRSERGRRNAILRAARQQAVNLTTLDAKALDRDVQRILEGATGDFKTQFEAGAGELTSLLTKNQAVSTGEVLEAGIVTADDDSAQVLVVVDSRVTNSETPTGDVRHYRMQLSLIRQGDRWLTSDLQFR